MSKPLSTTECSEVMDRFDSYLDGSLDDATASQFERHLESCTVCTSELAVAQRMQVAFEEMNLAHCPDDVFQRVVATANASQNGRIDHASLPNLRQLRTRRWKVYALAASVLLVLGLGSLPFVLNDAPDQFTPEEVAQARQEVELALRLVSDAGRETGVFLQNDVLVDEVVEPIQQALLPTP